MAPPKKEYIQCAHCGRKQQKINDSKQSDGFIVKRVKEGKFYMISCPCGIITKLCHEKYELQAVWNSRPKKPFEPPQLTVKHPAPRGMSKGDQILRKLGPKDPF
jgi:hypothetical protein